MENDQTSNSDILIALIGDTHLRDSQYATSRRGDDFFAAAFDAVEKACEVADVIVLTGDIFDRPRPSPKVIGQLMQIDTLLRSAGKTAFAITGNHDWSNPTWISTLFQPPEQDDIIHDGEGIVPLDNTSVSFRGYTFAGLEPHTAATFRNNLATIINQVKHADVVLFHGLVAGVAKFPIHTPDPLHVSELPVSQSNKAWLLGDIHVQGFTEVDRPRGGKCLIGYPGSTEMCSASEPLEKSVPIIRLDKSEGASLHSTIPIINRPFIQASVRDDAQLDELMLKLEAVKDKHPVVVVQFARELPQTISRIHSMLDAQRAVIRCYPLPRDNVQASEQARQIATDEDHDMEFFVSRRFEGREDLQKVALDLLHRGESDASNIVSDMVDARQAAMGVREE